ncbi:MAG: type II secretion system major pseudopilin GspG [Gemmatimonadales bacterium]|nr:type II secretion system major pseudopilin GspG [Gemmatimonadales bacterium]
MVVSLIAVLAAVVAPMVFRNVGDAKQSAAKSQLGVIELALDAYRLDNDYYPTTEQGLAALTSRPVSGPPARNWRGPYLKRDIAGDPWGHPYLYRSPAQSGSPDSFEVASLGRDGRQGGAGEDADLAIATPGAVPQ